MLSNGRQILNAITHAFYERRKVHHTGEQFRRFHLSMVANQVVRA